MCNGQALAEAGSPTSTARQACVRVPLNLVRLAACAEDTADLVADVLAAADATAEHIEASDAVMIDSSDRVVMPGLIDTDRHTDSD
jgi:cytosine/adenosine deaminase-related metal-dependent hydrolase